MMEENMKEDKHDTPIFRKRSELVEILKKMMFDEIGYGCVGSECRMVFSPYGDAEDIGIFTVYIGVRFKYGEPDMLTLWYIRETSNEDDKLDISREIPDDFTPEVTAGAIFDTLTQKSRSNIKVIKK